MWPFKKLKTLDIGYNGSAEPPKLRDYRIVPKFGGTYQVEIYSWGYGNVNHWQIPGARAYTYEATSFATEKEAEEYIFKKRSARLEEEARVRKIKEFEMQNPPREVPPYKFL